MVVPEWHLQQYGEVPKGVRVWVHYDSKGKGQKVIRQTPDGTVVSKWTLPSGQEANSEAEYIEGLHRMRP